jgi:hypothetical protein
MGLRRRFRLNVELISCRALRTWHGPLSEAPRRRQTTLWGTFLWQKSKRLRDKHFKILACFEQKRLARGDLRIGTRRVAQNHLAGSRAAFSARPLPGAGRGRLC